MPDASFLRLSGHLLEVANCEKYGIIFFLSLNIFAQKASLKTVIQFLINNNTLIISGCGEF